MRLSLAEYLATRTDKAFAEELRADLHARRAELEAQGIDVDKLKIYPETVRRYRLPAAHTDFRVPKRPVMQSIHRVTRGAVDANSFYDIASINGSAGGGVVTAPAGGDGTAPGYHPARTAVALPSARAAHDTPRRRSAAEVPAASRTGGQERRAGGSSKRSVTPRAVPVAKPAPKTAAAKRKKKRGRR